MSLKMVRLAVALVCMYYACEARHLTHLSSQTTEDILDENLGSMQRDAQPAHHWSKSGETHGWIQGDAQPSHHWSGSEDHLTSMQGDAKPSHHWSGSDSWHHDHHGEPDTMQARNNPEPHLSSEDQEIYYGTDVDPESLQERRNRGIGRGIGRAIKRLKTQPPPKHESDIYIHAPSGSFSENPEPHLISEGQGTYDGIDLEPESLQERREFGRGTGRGRGKATRKVNTKPLRHPSGNKVRVHVHENIEVGAPAPEFIKTTTDRYPPEESRGHLYGDAAVEGDGFTRTTTGRNQADEADGHFYEVSQRVEFEGTTPGSVESDHDEDAADIKSNIILKSFGSRPIKL